MGNRRFPAKKTQAIEAKHADTHSEEIHHRSGNRYRDFNFSPSSKNIPPLLGPQFHSLLVAHRRRYRILVSQTPAKKKALRKRVQPIPTSHKPGSHSDVFENEGFKPGRETPMSFIS